MWTVIKIRLFALVALVQRHRPQVRAPRDDAGQTTAEYALVLLGAASLALLMIAWAAQTGRIGTLFDTIFDRVVADAT